MIRAPHLFAPAALATLTLLATSRSDAADPSADDASIGTRPAARAGASMPPPAPAPASVEESSSPFATPPSRSRYDLAVATDPPTDWAVLHAGLRPHLGTFGGIATFALAHERTEQFYGAFSLSGIRNDAGTHVGIAQLSLGRNLSDTFV